MTKKLATLAREIESCARCPRLVAHREAVAREKRRAYRDETYWGRPIAGFGDPAARILIVGLAPGAHGANRTGRIFTGDRSGDFLYGALHRAGLASQPTSTHRDDGLVLRGVFITMPCRCAPPDNKPTPDELAACREWFDRERALLPEVTVVLALGALAWKALGASAPFVHGQQCDVGKGTAPPLHALASYHVSQQNTQTGRLTERMFDTVLSQAKTLARLKA